MSHCNIGQDETVFDAFEHWHHVTCRSYSVTECRHEVGSTFRAKLATRILGKAAIGETSVPAFASIHLQRGADHVRKDQVDDFMALHVVEGDVGFSQGGRSFRGGRGDFFLYDQTQPFTFDINGRHHLSFVKIPRAAMTERLSGAERLTARSLRHSKVGHLARTCIHQLLMLDDLSAPAAERLGSAALDIIAAAFDPAASAGFEPGRCHKLLETAQAFMVDRLADNDLNVERVAHAIGVAPRTLNRIFASKGVTPMRWLWQQRLAAAHNRLLRHRHVTVTQVALECGFSNLGHFSRLFKDAFGICPTALVQR